MYRDVNYDAVFRDLTKVAISDIATEIATEYTPQNLTGQVVKVDTPIVSIEFPKTLGLKKGMLMSLYNVDGAIVDPSTKAPLGNLARQSGIVKLDAVGANAVTGRILVSDGRTPIRVGDVVQQKGVTLATMGIASDTLYQVAGFDVAPEVDQRYHSSPTLLTEWLHDHLLRTGRYKLLPPVFRQKDQGTAEIGLSRGEFQVMDQQEIISQLVRQPDVSIKGRIVKAALTIKNGEFKNKLSFEVSVEVTFVDSDGHVLAHRGLVGKHQEEQVLSRGRIVKGIDPKTYPQEFNRLTESIIQKLVEE